MLLVLYKEGFERYSVYFVSLAVGVLLGASFLELIPEAMEILPKQSLLFVLLGFLSFYLLENMVIIHSCPEGDCPRHQIVGWMSFLGLLFHSLVDGIAIGAGFGLMKGLGIMIALAVIFHEFPEGVLTTALLLKAEFPRRRILFFAISVALATPVGVILSYAAARDLHPSILAALLAFTAGTFLYIAATDLLPETHKDYKKSNIFLVFFGVGFMFLLTKTIHSH